MGVEGWEMSPRQVILMIGAFVMAFMVTATGIVDHLIDRHLSILFTFLFISFALTATYVQLWKRYGETWSMASKEWREPMEGAADAIGDVLMGEGISYARRGPTRTEGLPRSSADEVFETEGLRIMVAEGVITRVYVGPISILGSKKAGKLMRLVDGALG